jgi:serine/threonine protein kinase
MSSLPARDLLTDVGTPPRVPLAPDLRAGTRLAGYRLDSLIGRGGMGVVYRAEHLHLRRSAALKLLLPEFAHEAGFRERFLRESQVAAAIQHPNIVTVYDAGEADGLLYIAMQHIDGTDLAALLRREGALQPEQALSILGQVADALDAAHALDVVHRDVKPGNVLIDSKRCYLTDFGLTRRLGSEAALTLDGQVVGTIDYVPPEQIRGGPLDPRADVYALGCVLYHALVGHVPYVRDSHVSSIYAHMHEQPPPPSATRSGLGGELDAVIAQALAKRKEDRYDSCGALIAAARAAVGCAEPPSVPTLLRTPAGPRQTVLVAAGEPGIRALVRVSLEERRFNVLEAADSESALALARSECVDVLLVDWKLPGRPSTEVCRALRAGPETAGTKILVLATRSDALDEATARAAGADGSIRKPFSSMQLVYKLGELVDAPAAH